MGNQLAPPSKPGVEHSAELLNAVFKETLGEQLPVFRLCVQGMQAALDAELLLPPCSCAGPGRLLKSLLCLHDNGGLVVVKVWSSVKVLHPQLLVTNPRPACACLHSLYWHVAPQQALTHSCGCSPQVFDKRKDVNSLVAYKQQLEAIRSGMVASAAAGWHRERERVGTSCAVNCCRY
jgi:hypothetical protein